MRRDYNSTTRFRQKVWGRFPFTSVGLFSEEGLPVATNPGCQTFWSLPDLEFQILEKSLRIGRGVLADLHSMRVFFRDAQFP